VNQEFRIMVVDDEFAMRESLAGWLEREGYEVELAASGQEALDLLESKSCDLMLLDIKMPGMDGLELLDRLGRQHPEVQVVMITAYGSIETAVHAMKQGARDYLLKPFDPEQLMILVEKLVEHHALVHENRELKERLRQQELQNWGDLIADSPAMRRVIALIHEVGPSDTPVLITGETGTGKELVARALHAASPRAGQPFVAINCGAQSESLLESELFGHQRGAFTGAVRDRRGRLEMAHGGSLFLDEVGDIPLKMQVDLLRVLEERRFQRVGGDHYLESDFRLICATHRDLPELVRQGDFRQDFYYRINVIGIHIPPLRERPEDIGLLAVHFLRQFAAETGKPARDLGPEALNLLASYSWPGNVRELKNVMERSIVIGRGQQVMAGELTFLSSPQAEEQGALTLADLEKRHIARILEANQGNMTQSARILGIDRSTLARKVKRYGLRAQA
jgi:two-component system response regulator HydG